ncbi:MAG: RecQ family ATP-dependent DNA helicase [Pedobacter sp.]|nr:MAG: RecQ family ATP-dependent DNA helicase [Pedobacter sp.]
MIHDVVNGKDVLALMPTGGGKSLCYQVPAMMQEELCLVISPLIALMKDQVENLRKRSITAFAIYTGMSRKEVMHILKTASESNCQFLYVSPERLQTKLFLEYLPGLNVGLIAVDEAHCISQWGYDFRPPYLRITDLRKELPGVPVLALTASATPSVQQDICDKLSLHPRAEWKVFRQSFERPNIVYRVIKTGDKYNQVIALLEQTTGTAIVYCKSRKRTREISDILQMHGISADFYHAGLSQDERSKRQENWINNSIRVIVCTNAFGMGIDKPDVRVVVHADMPDCLENYYQEAGRAGRDGQRSEAVLLCDQQEITELRQSPNTRYPSLEYIRTVYQAVSNYLQIPVGGGEGESRDFDMSDFARKFDVKAYPGLFALKALEQDGWLSFNEVFFSSSVVQFTTSKRELYDFEEKYPALEPLIKSLLRAYEGIFDQPVHIAEKSLARLLRVDDSLLPGQLAQLHKADIISYQPQKDKPQLIFLRPRVKVDELQMNMAAYEERKKLFIQRIEKMIAYTAEKNICRSRFIGSYFGDNEMRDCGVCDNCTQQKKQLFDHRYLAAIYTELKKLIPLEGISANELLVSLHTEEERLWQVLGYLQRENKITVDAKGVIRLKA